MTPHDTPTRRLGGLRLLPGLSRTTIGREAMAGVTLLALAVPLNIGYAQIAGLPPAAGLLTLVVPSIVFALTASSRQVVASPDAAAAALIASSLTGMAAAGSGHYVELALAQALLGGVFFVLMSLWKLGFLANFLSEPILVGFVAGLALEVLVSQVAKMLGIRLEGGEFVEKLRDLVAGLDTVHAWPVATAGVSVAVLLAGRRLAPRVPWALVVLVGATSASVALDLRGHGVSVLGAVDGGLPSLTWPSLKTSEWLALVPSALALTLITTAEGLLVSRSYSQKNGYANDPNRDLLAFGLANAAAGATGGFTVGSSVSRTAAVDQAGSRTQLPSIVAAVGALALLVFGTSLLEDIPTPTIGAIITVAVVPLLGVRDLRRLWHADRLELTVAVVCLLGAILLGPIQGIVVAFVLALVNLARTAATPAVDVLRADGDPGASLLDPAGKGVTTAPGLLVVRFAAPLFFANAVVLDSNVREAVAAAADPVRHVVLDLEAVTGIDVTAAESLHRLREHLAEHGVSVGYSRVRPATLERLRHFDLVGHSPVYLTNRDALTALGTDRTPGG
jgi:high affinity sulfate transporter 1